MQKMIKFCALRTQSIALFFAWAVITTFSNSLNVQAQYNPSPLINLQTQSYIHANLDSSFNDLDTARQLFKKAFATIDEIDEPLTQPKDNTLEFVVLESERSL